MGKLSRRIILLLMFFFIAKETYAIGYQYLFWQQLNDACILASVYNLNRLETLKQKYKLAFESKNILLIPDEEWLTHRQWFGKEYLLLKSWHESMDPEITLGSTEQDSADAELLKFFLTDAVTRGAVGPYVYDEHGKRLFTGYFEKLGTPFFLYEYDKIPESIQPDLGIYAPLVQEKGTWRTFDITQQKFVPMPPEITITPAGISFIGDSARYPVATPIANKVLGSPSFSTITGRFLGFDKMTKTYQTALGFTLSDKVVTEQRKRYVPYLLGLYKLMFLTLGIDNDNNPVPREGHALSQLCNAVKRRVSKDPNNPWNPVCFSPDKLLQYELTKLFFEDEELYEAAKATVNCLHLVKGFATYQRFQEKLKAGELYKKTDDTTLIKYDATSVNAFLPGEKQVVAYYVSQSIYFLWYGAMAPLAVLKIFGMDGWKARLGLPAVKTWIYFNERSARKKIAIKNQDPQSFLDVWQKIATHFKTQTRKNWVSFDGHGWVISFDEQLFAIQKEYPIYNKPLFNDLGIAVIESWIGRMLPVFYKK